MPVTKYTPPPASALDAVAALPPEQYAALAPCLLPEATQHRKRLAARVLERHYSGVPGGAVLTGGRVVMMSPARTKKALAKMVLDLSAPDNIVNPAHRALLHEINQLCGGVPPCERTLQRWISGLVAN